MRIEKEANFIQESTPITGLSFRPRSIIDGGGNSYDTVEILAIGSVHTVKIWRVPTNPLFRPLNPIPEKIVKSEPKTSMGQSDFADNNDDSSISKNIPALLFETSVHRPFEISDLAWQPSGNILASCDTGGKIHLIKAQDNFKFVLDKESLEAPLTVKQFFCICWSPTHINYIAAGGLLGNVIVFDVNSKDMLARLRPTNTETGPVKGLAWNPEGQFLAVQCDNDRRLMVWKVIMPDDPEMALPKCRLIVNELSDIVRGPIEVLYGRKLSWSADGRCLSLPYGQIMGSFCGLIYTTNVGDCESLFQETEPLGLFGHLLHVCASSFNSRVCIATDSCQSLDSVCYAQASQDGILSLWSYKLAEKPEMQSILVCKNFLDEQSSVVTLAWNDGGNLLAVGSSNGCITFVALF